MSSAVPPWLKKRVTISEDLFETRRTIASFGVNTVCESAKCPNASECFSKKFATFMILGKHCTRGCAFCSVAKDIPEAVDTFEPRRIADCVKQLGMKYVIITSVTRDDLDDGGASQFVKTIEAVRNSSRDVTIELLIPDFKGERKSIEIIARSGVDIIGHNIETVKRLYPEVRSGADYSRSLDVLRAIKELNRGQLTKSAILAGLGEREEEIIDTMKDLRASGCDIVTIGQYLSPGKEHVPVKRFVTPEEFERLKSAGERLGFLNISSGPFVRSSYLAEEAYNLHRRGVIVDIYCPTAAVGQYGGNS